MRGLVLRGLASGEKGVIDEGRVFGMYRTLLASPRHHATLAFINDKAVAYLGAMRSTTFTAKDRYLVAAWYSEHPGAGMLLMRELLRRARAEPDIGDVLITVHADHQQKIALAMRRYGATAVPTFHIPL